MNLRKLKKIFKLNDGGVIKFVDQYRKKTFYFEMSYSAALPIINKLKKRKDFIVLLSSNGDHKICNTLEAARIYFDGTESLKIGSILELDTVYGIANRQLILTLFDQIASSLNIEQYLSKDYEIYVSEPTRIEFSTFNPYQQPTTQKKKSSIFTVKKPVKREKFDWDEAYLEGLRIHGNRDDAESHADDEEYKFKHR